MAKFKMLCNSHPGSEVLLEGVVYDSKDFDFGDAQLKQWEKRGMLELGPNLESDPPEQIERIDSQEAPDEVLTTTVLAGEGSDEDGSEGDSGSADEESGDGDS